MPMQMGLNAGMMPLGMANTSPLVSEPCNKPKCKAATKTTKCKAGTTGCTQSVSPIVPQLPFQGMGFRGMDFRTGFAYGAQPRGQGLYLTLRRDKYPIHGGFSPWGGYSACSAVCGGGFMTRRRYCNNPIPQNGGMPCMGVRVQTVRCNTHQCPVRGNWGPWSEYSQCSAASCGMQGFQRRTRNCNNPPAMFGGLTCRGPAFQDRVCSFCPASNIGNSGMGGQCLDSNIRACKEWAKQGYCSSNLYYSYMSSRCCASCREKLAKTGATGGATGATGGATAVVQPPAVVTGGTTAVVQPPAVVTGGATGGSTGGTQPATGTGTTATGGSTGGTQPATGGSTGGAGTGTTGTSGTTAAACKDKKQECPSWKKNGLCDSAQFKAYMKDQCCESCNGSANIQEGLLEPYQMKYKKEEYLKRIAEALKKKKAEMKDEK